MRLKGLAAALLGVVCFLLAPGSLFAQPVASKTDLSSMDCGTNETTLGDLTADALRDGARVDMAFVPSSALRQISLPGATLTTSEIEDVFVSTTAPANAYAVLNVKGKQVIAALERSVSHLPESFAGFLQVSGIKVTFDLSKPEGSRVVSVFLLDGQPLSPDSQYTAAMTQPLGLGGMGYFQAWDSADIVKTSDTALSTVVSAYAAAHQPLDIQTDGRLTSQ